MEKSHGKSHGTSMEHLWKILEKPWETSPET
jgi:hypothetical protein